MADEPQNDETSEQAEDTSAEGSDASTAGPVAEGSPPAHPPEGQPSTPPAEEASEEQAEDDAAAEEPAEAPVAEQEDSDDAAAEEPAEAAPAAEQEEAAPDEAPEEEPAEQPKAEKKKDAIPGADLEPIAVETDARPLSAEEKARKEAEEEERARREAALPADSEEEQAASRAPAKMESDSRYLATGKRKNAIARVTLLPGSGKVVINGRPIEEFFPRPLHQTTACQPLVTTGYEGSVDVRARVHGGGVSGQAGAVRHGIARALIEVDPELRGELKRRGFLTRDARAKERRKAGLKKARKKPQFSKR